MEGSTEGAHWDAIRSLLPAYRSMTTVLLGDGKTTAFWEDRWNNGNSLAETYPALYSHVARHGASVREVKDNGLHHYLVSRLTPVAVAQLTSVHLLLDATVLTEQDDGRHSALATSAHRLSTSKIYRAATAQEQQCPHANFIWKNRAPPKVRFFAWLLIQDRVQHKNNLVKKHILDNDTCDLCHSSKEDADHLIWRCPFAQSFWSHIGWPNLYTVATLHAAKAPPGTPSEQLSTMLLLCCWQLWKHRYE
ncbi:unnamed protein product [Urochloa humidicola]